MATTEENFWTERRTIVALAVSILALAEIVDLTIVGVALPDIMGALGANINEISLTMTSYIVASAIFIPLTGFVSNKYGVKRVILVSALLFGVSSVLCGLSTSVTEMVIFRLLQGVGGAFLPSVAQAYIVNNFSKEEMPKIMTVYSLCVVMGPVIGPIFGGYIAEHMSWEWIFYVNVPICILGFLLVYFLMEETETEHIKTDYLSFLFLMVGVGCLEYFLDEGNSNSWLESKELVIILVTGILSTIFFVWRGILGKGVVNFKVFRDPNFNLSCFLVFSFLVIMVIAMAYFPTLLQQGYGYPVDTAGYITAPRGMCAFIAAPIFMALGKKLEAKYVILIGLIVFALSCLTLCWYGYNQSKGLILLTVILQGIGLTGAFIPLMQLAFVKIPEKLNSDASGMFNFFRNIGNSVGTSIAATLISRSQQSSWHDLASHVSKMNPNFHAWNMLMPSMPLSVQVSIASMQIQAQSFLVANLNVAYVSLVGAVLLLIIPFFLIGGKLGDSDTTMIH